MSTNFIFVLPLNVEDLLTADYGSGHYSVGDVLTPSELAKAFKVAQAAYRDLGPVYILQHFDTFYSVLKQYADLPRVVIHGAFEDLKKCLLAMPNFLGFYLEDEARITDEVKQEVQNILKMTVYLYVSLYQCLEHSYFDDSSLSDKARKRGRSSTSSLDQSMLKVDWTQVVSVLKVLFQMELPKFWDINGIEDAFLNKVMELVVVMLEDSQIRTNKMTQFEMWALFGLLITTCAVNNALIIRLARLVKDHEYMVPIMGECVQHLVEQFNAKAFMVALVVELTEWQMQELNVESNASRNCTRLVIDLAGRLPFALHEMLEHLWKFLRSDSHQLRTMVLGVTVEVVDAGVRGADTLQPAEKEQWRVLHREILSALDAFTCDSSMYVRSRVFGYVKRLVEDNSVPCSMVRVFLRRAITQMRDCNASVRKAAANCITSILQHNQFGPSLPYQRLVYEYNSRKEELVKLRYEVYGMDIESQEQVEQDWAMHMPALKVELEKLQAIPEESENEDDEDTDTTDKENHDTSNRSRASNANNVEAPAEAPAEAVDVDDLVRNDINAKRYTEAVKHCRDAATSSALYAAMREQVDFLSDVNFQLCYMRIVFSNISCTGTPPTQEQLDRLSQQEVSVEYHGDVVQFLDTMRDAMQVMCELLNSVTIGDMHEAVDFIITAKQFDLDDATLGINSLLNVMLRNEEDRRKIAGEALRKIFLTTDTKRLKDHTALVSHNLIGLYRNVATASIDALVQLITTWAKQGTLGNDIIDTLWGHFLRKIETTYENSRNALSLLRIAAMGRHSIVERNHRIVARVCLVERMHKDPLLAVEGMHFVCMMARFTGRTHTDAPFRFPPADVLWEQLLTMLKYYRNKQTPVAHNLIASAVRMTFTLHKYPFQLIERMAEGFNPSAPNQPESTDDEMTTAKVWRIIRYNVFVGEVAMGMLEYLDTDVYRELKRRQLVKMNRTRTDRKSKGMTPLLPDMSASRRKRAQDTSNSTHNSTLGANLDESAMDGADAMDEDADFISHVLEQSLNITQPMGKLYRSILHICCHPNRYPNEVLQVSAATALARGMLLSTQFCETHVQLLFTILTKSKYPQVIVSLLVHIVDLIDRCPNHIEPYTSKLYKLLEDKNLSVRQTSLNIVSLLILKDMIRPQGDIWRLAVCLVDEEPSICRTARNFFLQSTSKSNNLYNYMPDIFTHLCNRYPRAIAAAPPEVPPLANGMPEPPIDPNEENFQKIMRYLFSLVDKSKHVEVLVERFCLKFDNADDEQAKRIAFALSLMQYNDKALQKLLENFARYKQFVMVDEVYSWMKVIYAGAKGKELKGLVTQLEDQVKELFKVDGRVPRNVFKKPTVPKKKPAPAKNGAKVRNNITPTKGRTQRRRSSQTETSSDDSDDGFDEEQPAGKKRAVKRHRARQSVASN